MNDILDIKEAASFTGLSEQTLRRYANDGKVQAMRKGTRYFFTKEALKKLLSPMALEVLQQAEASEEQKTPPAKDRIVFLPVPLSRLPEFAKQLESEVPEGNPFLEKTLSGLGTS